MWHRVFAGNLLRKDIHQHKKHDHNGNDFYRGADGVGIKNFEHGMVFFSGCKTAKPTGRYI
jgi:hypothetical protein